MSLETKAIIIMMANIVRKASSFEEIYEALEEVARSDGFPLKPFREDDDKKKTEHPASQDA